MFLFGPPRIGKSTIIHQSLPSAKVFDLATDDYLAIDQNHTIIDRAAIEGASVIVIDEVERMPDLLDKVHHLIETQNTRFLLTGSYSRKLRRAGHNLLGGRVGKICLRPLLLRELGDDFNLQRALQYGTMPSVYQSKTPRKHLESYVNSYLRKEVEAEVYTSNLPRFNRLLEVVAQCNATTVNFNEVSRILGLEGWIIVEYFALLQQMLHVFELRAWNNSRTSLASYDSKYFFSDVGILNTVLGHTVLSYGTDHYASAFKTWMMNELMGWVEYASREQLRFWRSLSGIEVDCLIGDHTAVLINPKGSIEDDDLRPLRALREENIVRRFICICFESNPRRIDDIEIVPYWTFLANLWESEYTTIH